MLNKLYELKEQLCEELESYASSGINRQNIADIDTLAHAAKNICKIIEFCEGSDGGEGYSRRPYRNSMMPDPYGYSGYSYNRGRRDVMRDSMGQYSGHDQHEIVSIADDMRKLAEKLPDNVRGDVMRLSEKLRNLEE